MAKKLLFLLSIFIFITNITFATRITRKETKCPLCDTKFTAPVVMSTNNFGGIDYDLCPHAVGSSPLSSYVWGCPYCNFCGYPGVFKKEYTNEEKTKIQNWLKENYPPTIEKPKQDNPTEEDEEEPVKITTKETKKKARNKKFEEIKEDRSKTKHE